MSFVEIEETSAADLAKGAIAGALAGLAGTYVMTQVQPYAKQWSEQAVKMAGVHEAQGGGGASSTGKLATAVAEPVVGRQLTQQEKQAASQGVHYGFGTLMGTVYGTVAEAAPGITSLLGIPAGVLLFLMADETGVPAAGLSKPPTQMPASTHLYGLASHIIYGLTTELCRKVIRPLLGS